MKKMIIYFLILFSLHDLPKNKNGKFIKKIKKYLIKKFMELKVKKNILVYKKLNYFFMGKKELNKISNT